jgi:hypothetical protein
LNCSALKNSYSNSAAGISEALNFPTRKLIKGSSLAKLEMFFCSEAIQQKEVKIMQFRSNKLKM